MLFTNTLKITSVLPQQDGPDTAVKCRLLVEIILLVALGLEVHSQLCKRGVEAKMLTPRNPIEKNTDLIRDTAIRKTIMEI